MLGCNVYFKLFGINLFELINVIGIIGIFFLVVIEKVFFCENVKIIKLLWVCCSGVVFVY